MKKGNLKSLLERASNALPPQRPSKATYRHLESAVTTLKERGFTTQDAVDWLINEGEIEPEKRESAYRSLRQLLIRRQPKPQAD